MLAGGYLAEVEDANLLVDFFMRVSVCLERLDKKKSTSKVDEGITES